MKDLWKGAGFGFGLGIIYLSGFILGLTTVKDCTP